MSGTIEHQIPPALGAHRVAIVAARFNDEIVSQLIAGALRAYRKAGGKPAGVEFVRVPGAFELPVAARRLAFAGQFSAIVALGCVVRGDTPHFDFVAGECARGLMQVSLETGVPIIFGVLTTETFEQAHERADIAKMDKGGESMQAAIEMASLLSRW
ncbi:MAG: 6,7-dimethyl-8-ribityllumazine synthase [Proteobacteria bacterium]|nr:6,7-dimethyl-8-ribityllumazine synthase [Pseudomonadota bacterium]